MSLLAAWPTAVAADPSPASDRPATPSRRPWRTRLAAAAVAAGIAFSDAAPANAVVQYVGGGTWNWGAAGGNNWSNYLHGTKAHGSSVEGDFGLVRSLCKRAGVWSTVTTRDTNPFRIDRAYWRHC